MPNNPYTRKRGSPKSYMRKASISEARAEANSSAIAAVSNSNSSSGGKGSPGEDGANGWSPELAVVADGERRVFRLIGWLSGSGETPGHEGEYLGATGFVTAIGEATDIRGPQGPQGEQGPPGEDAL